MEAGRRPPRKEQSYPRLREKAKGREHAASSFIDQFLGFRFSLLSFVNQNLTFLLVSGLDDLMESKGGKKKISSKSLFYEAPLGYSIEDIRPNGGIKKFRSAAYSNCARKPS
ncbi:uncharacterized protein LOC110657826 [Hevea brasiliensis]|uniref:uncharacterized protein LOC110657826 n=1 Tax=Hevea brasiliensis TaxID=3981 RepID=UPI0025D3C0D1|nr:uncharacterized protein LOC110657826 [Hevea brasiliensis]